MLHCGVEDEHDTVRDYLNARLPAGRPVPGSPLKRECQGFPDPDAVITAFDHGVMLINLVADQLVALTRSLSRPYLSLASWTTLRMILESAPVSAWLLDPRLDATARVRRSYAHRYKGQTERVSFARATNSPDLAAAKRQLDALVKSAGTLGFPPVVNKKNETIGAGEKMPSSTDLAGMVFNQGGRYEVLSAFVYGHQWASNALGYAWINDGTGEDARVVQWMEPFHMVGLLTYGFLWFAKPIWYRSRLNGYDLPLLVASLERHAHWIAEKERFWRDDG